MEHLIANFSFLEENQSDTNGSGSREFPSYLTAVLKKNANPLLSFGRQIKVDTQLFQKLPEFI